MGSTQASAFASHTHGIHGVTNPGGTTMVIQGVNSSLAINVLNNTDAAGGSTETRPINTYVNYIIKT